MTQGEEAEITSTVDHPAFEFYIVVKRRRIQKDLMSSNKIYLDMIVYLYRRNTYMYVFGIPHHPQRDTPTQTVVWQCVPCTSSHSRDPIATEPPIHVSVPPIHSIYIIEKRHQMVMICTNIVIYI